MKRYTPHLWLFFVLVGSSAALAQYEPVSPPAPEPMLALVHVVAAEPGELAGSRPRGFAASIDVAAAAAANRRACTALGDDDAASGSAGLRAAKSVHACPGSAGLSCAGAVAAGR